MSSATITLIIIGVMCVMYIVDKFPVAIVTLAGMLAMVYANVLPFKDAFANFGSTPVLIIRFGELKNEAIRRLYNVKRTSPYRNFAPRVEDYYYTGNVLYYFILDDISKVESIEAQIKEAPWADTIRIRTEERDVPEGYKCIRIFPAEASKERMLAKLQEMIGATDTVTFGSDPGKYDIFVENADKDLMVKELKHRFEKVSLKGWRNMLAWH
ncbi:MAG TPA: hypothetical protein DHV42_08530 [Lachnospiraceae bacterium]|nr:hypothetical protein [Lachnospiraceae bacterium]